MKEIQLRPGISDHDLETKVKQIRRLCKKNDRIKVAMRFRGREVVHTDLGDEILNWVVENTEDIARVESRPPLKGNTQIMILRSLLVKEEKTNSKDKRKDRGRQNRSG